MSPQGGALLVVDDNEDNRYTLTQRLKRLGHADVATANDGRQALGMLRARPFDLVLLDIMMPELDGYQVLAELKADEQLRHIPVIMISAVDELESVIRCVELGAEDYLQKPFNPTLLRARIGACLEKKRLRDELVEWNKTLEQRVEDTVAEVERLGRLDLRGIEGMLEAFQGAALEAEVGEIEANGLLVEDANHALLPEGGGQDRHAQVGIAAPVAQADAPVLGQPALRDVETGHDLEPRDDRRLQAPGQGPHLVHDAVDAQAPAEDALVGLPVDVSEARRSMASIRVVFTRRTIGGSSAPSRSSKASASPRESPSAAGSSSAVAVVMSPTTSVRRLRR